MTVSTDYLTGLDGETRFDQNGELQLLSVAVVDSQNILLYLPVRPVGLSCEEIELMNNLPFSAEVLAIAPPPSVVRNVVKEMVRGSTVVVWNEEHERRLFPFLNEKNHEGQNIFPVQDAMKRSAPYVKDWNPYFSAYEYPSLDAAATHFGVEFSEPGWHDARADAKMTLEIWHKMERNPPFPVSSSIIAPHRTLPVPINVEEACPF